MERVIGTGVVQKLNIVNKPLWKRLFEQKELQIMVIPGIILLIIFKYLPFYGLVIAFKDFDVVKGIWGSNWIGLAHFKEFFTSPYFSQAIINTLCISILKIIFTFPIPIIFALLLNEIQTSRGKSLVQGISYLPHFVSWVVCYGVLSVVIAKDGGAINTFLISLGIIEDPIHFIGEPRYFWPLLIVFDNWKEMGWGAIIYIAAISGIDPELYEAGFEQIFVFRNPMVENVANIIDTYVYDTGIKQGRYDYATAIGMFKSVIAFFMVWGSNWIASKKELGLW